MSSSLDAAEPVAPAHLTLPADAWKLTFFDEFSGDKIDESKWRLNLPWGGTDGTGRHHNPLYASYIMDHNIALADGVLKLATRREEVTAKNGKQFHFTQAMITTSSTFRQQYGYFEARVKIPVEAGPGLWPAFWTLSDGWPPEMDICEVWTALNKSHQGLCYRPETGGRERWDDENVRKPLPTAWTTYGMEWGPGYQLYNIDGQVTKRVFGDHVTRDKHYILLNSGVDAQDPPTESTVFPNEFLVDYVRVFARPDQPAFHNGSFEDSDLRPWRTYGRVLQVGYAASDGKHAVRIEGKSGMEQKVYGLKPNSTYVLQGHVRSITAGEARIGVKDHGRDEVFVASPAKADGEFQLEFTSGANSETATVYCYVPDTTGAAMFDELRLSPKSKR